MSDHTSSLSAFRDAGIRHAFTAEDAEYFPALKAFDTAIELAPRIVVEATSVEDVAAAVSVAQSAGDRVVALGTGHGFLDGVSGGVMISTRRLAAVEADFDRRVARVGAGTVWSQVLAEVTPHGLAGLCGSAPGVGVIGYLLGGGIGPLARTYGVSADHVREIEIVTPADGLVTTSASQNPDLFWALRGGKGGFGIVTSMTIDLLPIERVVGGGIYFAAADAPAALRAFVEWAPELPATTTASIALLRLPDAPALPAALRGRYVAHLRFASTGELDSAERERAPMLEVADPLVNSVGELPYARLGEIHGDPTDPMPVTSGGAALDAIVPDLAEALLAVAGPDTEVPISAVELRVLGGAVASERGTPNAVGARGAAGNLFVSGAPVPGAHAEVLAAVRSVIAAVEPWRHSENLINFVGGANREDDVARAWSAEQRSRLDAIRDRVDPERIFPFDAHR